MGQREHNPANPSFSNSRSRRNRNVVLYFTVFVSGAIVLVLEILGTRLLSPYFGNNLYVWSALISVTLLALALGYWIGGRLADWRGTPVLLDQILAGSAVWISIIPPVVRSVPNALSEVTFQVGVLLSALICFGPALFLLGMVTPIAVRIATPDFDHVGRSSGAVYAYSTAGSILGALAAGFLLLPRIPVSRICYAVALALWVLIVGRWLGRSRTFRASLVAVLALAAAGGVFSSTLTAPRSWTVGPSRVVSDRPSFYGTVRVVETKRLRLLLVDGTSQTVQTRLEHEPILSYVSIFGVLPYLRPSGTEMLLLGLGGGGAVRLLREHGIRTTAVEIDPVVAEMAFKHFGLSRDEVALAIDDGRNYLRRHQTRFDFVILDAFAGGSPPSHLFSREAFAEMKRHLRSRGVLSVNMLVGGHRDPLAADLAATLKSVFANLLVVATEADSEELGSMVFFASEAPLEWPDRWEPRPADSQPEALPKTLGTKLINLDRLPGRVITDELNPLDLRVVSVERRLRARARSLLPRSILEP
jgi:spermidine synthase